MAGRIRAAAGSSSSTSRPTSEGSSRTKRPSISKMASTFLLIFVALLLVGDAAAADKMNVIFSNKLPEDVTVYWEGADRRIPQGDPIPAGGEHSLSTFPGHKFTYDFGGERHRVQIQAGRELEVLEVPKGEAPDPKPAVKPDVDGVKSKLQQKIQDVRDHPVVDKTATALAKTAHAIDEVSQKAKESEALDKARNLYAKASKGAGSAAHKLADRVAPSASAKYVSEISDSSFGFIVIVLGGIASIAALSVCSSYFKRRQKRRTFPGVQKEKADLDYKGSDLEGGAVLHDGNGEWAQPSQLYHEFEYKMRHRYQGTSYSYSSADSPPPQDRDPPARRMPRRQSIEQTKAHTYRQSSVGPNGEPILVTSGRDRPAIKQLRKGCFGKYSRKRLLATAIGLAGVGYVGVTYFMPTDMSFSELWLFVAEFVDAKLGHHGLIL